MAVDVERVNDLLADYNERVTAAIQRNGLDAHMGTSILDPVQKLVNDYTNMVTEKFSSPDTTEGMLMSEGDAMVNQVEIVAAQIAEKQTATLAGFAAIGNGPMSAADDAVWNEVVRYAAGEVDRLAKVYGEAISNMPKAMRNKLDTDLASVLDSVHKAHAANPSPGNADAVRRQLEATFTLIEKDLSAAVKAAMAESIESLAQNKLTKLQELEIALISSEKGMEKAQRSAWRSIAADTKKLISDLTSSNYLVYDKSVRAQKLAVIDNKMKLLDQIRVNATTHMQTLSGYFGNTGVRPSTKTAGMGSIGHAPHQSPSFRTKPPGFRGYTGGGAHPFED